MNGAVTKIGPTTATIRQTAGAWMLTEADKKTIASAAQALHNLVYNSSDDCKVKWEIRIHKLLEIIRSYADRIRDVIMYHVHHHNQEIDNRLPILLDGNFVYHDSFFCTNWSFPTEFRWQEYISMHCGDQLDEDVIWWLSPPSKSQLEALQGLSELFFLDQMSHRFLCDDAQSTTLRRYTPVWR